jgi:hypothetical protein
MRNLQPQDVYMDLAESVMSAPNKEPLPSLASLDPASYGAIDFSTDSGVDPPTLQEISAFGQNLGETRSRLLPLFSPL